MALEDIPDRIAAKVATLPGSPVRMLTSDYRTDLEQIPEDESRFQIRTLAVSKDTENSNDSRSVLGVQITVAHKLERAGLVGMTPDLSYTRDMLLPATRAIVDRSWWSSIDEVLYLREIEIETAREGHVVTYTVTAEITVAV